MTNKPKVKNESTQKQLSPMAPLILVGAIIGLILFSILVVKGAEGLYDTVYRWAHPDPYAIEMTWNLKEVTQIEYKLISVPQTILDRMKGKHNNSKYRAAYITSHQLDVFTNADRIIVYEFEFKLNNSKEWEEIRVICTVRYLEIECSDTHDWHY